MRAQLALGIIGASSAPCSLVVVAAAGCGRVDGHGELGLLDALQPS